VTGAADTQAGEDRAAAVKTIAVRDWGWGMDYGWIEDRWDWSAWGWTRDGQIGLRERRGKGSLRRGKDRRHPLEEGEVALNQRA